jgi:hypothetical protein
VIRWGVLAAALASAGAAHAEPAPVFELSVVRAEGSGSCPSASEFERRVSARLGRVPFSDAPEQAIEVTLSRKEELWRAELVLRDGSGIVRGQRAIEAQGSDCAPLAEAAALAVALTIDPEAALGAPPSGAERPPELVMPPPPPPACLPARCPTPAPCPLCAPPLSSGATVAGSLRGVLTSGLLPGAAAGVELTAEAGTRNVRGALALLYLPETAAADTRFGFGLTAASAGVCGAFPLTAKLEFGLCGQARLGAIYAVVRELTPVDAGDQPWLALGAGVRLRFEPVAPLFLEIGGSAVVPLLDRTFEVEGFDAPVFESAAVGAEGFAGLGFRAP